MAIYTYTTNLKREVAICLDENGTLTIGWGEDGGSSDEIASVPSWDGGEVEAETTDFSFPCGGGSGSAKVKITVKSAGGDNMVDVDIEVTDCDIDVGSTTEQKIDSGSYNESFTIKLEPGGSCII